MRTRCVALCRVVNKKSHNYPFRKAMVARSGWGVSQSADKPLDSQLNIRCSSDMRSRVERFSNQITGKPADIARVFVEFGLRAAELHGYHNILGVIKRDVPVELTDPTLKRLIELQKSAMAETTEKGAGNPSIRALEQPEALKHWMKSTQLARK